MCLYRCFVYTGLSLLLFDLHRNHKHRHVCLPLPSLALLSIVLPYLLAPGPTLFRFPLVCLAVSCRAFPALALPRLALPRIALAYRYLALPSVPSHAIRLQCPCLVLPSFAFLCRDLPCTASFCLTFSSFSSLHLAVPAFEMPCLAVPCHALLLA